jgi:hypothetical protein
MSDKSGDDSEKSESISSNDRAMVSETPESDPREDSETSGKKTMDNL